MSVNWIQPLKFVKKSWDWRGLIEFQGSTVEVACKCFDQKGARNGASPQPLLAKKIDRLVQKAMKNHEHDMSEIAPALEGLYNQHWRPPRGRKLAAGRLKKELGLKKIDLAQGITRDQYQVILTDPRARFRLYVPKAEIDLGKIKSICLEAPCGPEGEPLLPYLGPMQHVDFSAEQSTQHVAKRVPVTKRTRQFKWVESLSYHAKEAQWTGVIEFQKTRLGIRIRSRTNEHRGIWDDNRLSSTLACISPAIKAVALQLTELHNDAWNEDRELSVTAVQRRIRLESLHFAEDETWSMWFADGDLFAGHRIRVDVDDIGEVTFELLG